MPEQIYLLFIKQRRATKYNNTLTIKEKEKSYDAIDNTDHHVLNGTYVFFLAEKISKCHHAARHS